MDAAALKNATCGKCCDAKHEKRDPTKDVLLDAGERKKGSACLAAAEKTDALHNRMFTFHLLDINQHGECDFPGAPKVEDGNHFQWGCDWRT